MTWAKPSLVILPLQTEFLKVHISLLPSALSLSHAPIEEKHLKERLALKYLSCLAKPVNPSFAAEIEELWWEFEMGDSEAARLVRSVDALECMDQAVVYEGRSQLDKDLGEFMTLEPKVNAVELRGWTECLKQDRKILWSTKEAATDAVFLFILGMWSFVCRYI